MTFMGLSFNIWIAICLVITLIGYIIFRYGQIKQQKNDPSGNMITIIAWFILIVGIMGAFTFFRGQYLS